MSGYTYILHDFIFVDSAESYLCRYGLESFFELTFLTHKTVLPATSALVHGVKIDTIDPELRLPQDKLCNLRSMLTKLSQKNKTTKKTSVELK